MQSSRFALLLFAAGTVAQASDPLELNRRGIDATEHGKYAEAERLYREESQIWRSRGPSFVAHFAVSRYNLGEALRGQGRWTEATAEFDWALEILRRTVGPSDESTLSAMISLANASMVLGDIGRAESLVREAIQQERASQTGSPLLSASLVTLAGVLSRTGRAAEALPPADEAVSLAVAAAGDGSVEAALAYAQAGVVHRVAGRPERALPLLRKARAIYERTRGTEYPSTASVISQEGLALMDLGQYGMAEHELTTALTTLSHCGGCGHEQVAAEINLGLLLVKEKKFERADSPLEEALRTEEQFARPAISDMSTILRLLAQVKEHEHHTAEAAVLRQRAAAFTASMVGQ